ncbi:ABC transporter permease [Cutibacterium acnes]|nr:transporter [Cutibacterium acnes C1]
MTSPGHPEPTAQKLPTTADPAVDPSHAQPQTSGRSRRPHRRGGGAFLLKRLGTYLIVAVVSVLLNFILPRFMPGDPATQLIKDIVAKTGAPPSGYQMRLIKARYGDPDRSVLLQFWDYLVQLAHGDLGKSIEYYPVNVTTLINQALPWTLYLAIASTILGWIVGTWLGVRLGWKPGRKLDSIVTPLIDVLQLDPSLLARPAHRMVLRLQERLVPQPGRLMSLTNGHFIASVLMHSVLPFFTLVIVGFAGWLFSMRNMMITTVNDGLCPARPRQGSVVLAHSQSLRRA